MWCAALYKATQCRLLQYDIVMNTREYYPSFSGSPYRMSPKLPPRTWDMPKTHVFAPYDGHDMCKLRAISGRVRDTLTYYRPTSSTTLMSDGSSIDQQSSCSSSSTLYPSSKFVEMEAEEDSGSTSSTKSSEKAWIRRAHRRHS